MTSSNEPTSDLGNDGDMNNDLKSGTGSISSGGNEDDSLSVSTTALQRQYSLIHQSYVSMKKREFNYCCANEKTRPWILRSLFLIVTALGLAIGYVEVRYSTYSAKNITLISGDQVLFPLSTFLNEKVEFFTDTIDSANLRLHVLRNKPNITSKPVIYESGIKFRLPSWTFQYWGFYLLAGTSVKISICADLQVQFYILKGKKKLGKWTQEILYNDYDYHKHIFPQKVCKKKSNFKSHLLTVSKSDTYYILFSSSNGWRFLTEVYVLLQFNRTYYDLSDLKYTCLLSNKSCSAYLDQASRDISLIEAVIPDENVSPFHRINLKYIPVPRDAFYLRLFGGIYLAILTLSAIYVIWRFSVNLSQFNTERESLVSSKHSSQQYNINTGEKPWVVVSNITRLSSREGKCEIEEKEDRSIIGDDSSNSYRHDSTSSREFMRHNNEVAHYGYGNEYNTSQQLLDTCLTSAGTSAI